jgi:hypothetical protein
MGNVERQSQRAGRGGGGWIYTTHAIAWDGREREEIRHGSEWEGASHSSIQTQPRPARPRARRQRAFHHQPGLLSAATRAVAGPSPLPTYGDPILTMRAIVLGRVDTQPRRSSSWIKQSDAETDA